MDPAFRGESCRLHASPVTPDHPGFRPLAVEARDEGYRFIDRLASEWEDAANRFDAAGECLFGITRGDALVAIGGLNADPYCDNGRTGRLRHVYVRVACRREGLGTLLIGALLAAAKDHFSRVRLRTDNPHAARLYEHLGFAAAGNADATHIFEASDQT